MTMSLRDRKRAKRVKYLFIALGFMELGMLIACISTNRPDDDLPIGRYDDYSYDVIPLNPVGPETEHSATTVREQQLKDAEERNSAILGLSNDNDVFIP